MKLLSVVFQTFLNYSPILKTIADTVPENIADTLNDTIADTIADTFANIIPKTIPDIKIWNQNRIISIFLEMGGIIRLALQANFSSSKILFL